MEHIIESDYKDFILICEDDVKFANFKTFKESLKFLDKIKTDQRPYLFRYSNINENRSLKSNNFVHQILI